MNAIDTLKELIEFDLELAKKDLETEKRDAVLLVIRERIHGCEKQLRRIERLFK